MTIRFKPGQICVLRGEKTRRAYFLKKYGVAEPTVIVEGSLDEVYGADWKSRFMVIPECFEFFAAVSFPIDQNLVCVRILRNQQKARVKEIVHVTELKRHRAVA